MKEIVSESVRGVLIAVAMLLLLFSITGAKAAEPIAGDQAAFVSYGWDSIDKDFDRRQAVAGGKWERYTQDWFSYGIAI